MKGKFNIEHCYKTASAITQRHGCFVFQAREEKKARKCFDETRKPYLRPDEEA